MKERLSCEFTAIDEPLKQSVAKYKDLVQAKKIRKYKRDVEDYSQNTTGKSEKRGASPPDECCNVSSWIHYRKNQSNNDSCYQHGSFSTEGQRHPSKQNKRCRRRKRPDDDRRPMTQLQQEDAVINLSNKLTDAHISVLSKSLSLTTVQRQFDAGLSEKWNSNYSYIKVSNETITPLQPKSNFCPIVLNTYCTGRLVEQEAMSEYVKSRPHL